MCVCEATHSTPKQLDNVEVGVRTGETTVQLNTANRPSWRNSWGRADLLVPVRRSLADIL